MGHDGVASGYPKPTGFRRLTSCQRDPQNRGVTIQIVSRDVSSSFLAMPTNETSIHIMFLL